MFRIIGDTRIDFMSQRRVWAAVSIVVVLVSVVLLLTRGLKLGVEFQGGAEVVLQFREPQDLREVRATLDRLGFAGAQVTTVSVSLLEQQPGEAAPAPGQGTGIQIKVPLPESYQEGAGGAGDSGDLAEAIIRGLRSERSGADQLDRPDLNVVDGPTLTRLLAAAPEVSEEDARRAADAVLAFRRGNAGLVPGLDELLADPGVAQSLDPAARRALRESVRVDPRADLNTIDSNDLASFLESRGGVPAEDAEAASDAIIGFRDAHRGVVASLETLVADAEVAETLTPEVRSVLEQQAVFGDFARRSNDFIGSQVSAEMRRDAILAISLSLVGMLVYIGVRFRGLQWGLAAIVALAHDVTITLGIFSLAGQEATLPVVAAFLTLVGYSVNDTIVVFDRIRENLRARRSLPMERVINESVNQTLSRTVLTSGTTWVVVASLFFFGGAVIHGFAFVLLVGVLVGTYSSVYVASPVMLFWQRWLAARRRARESVRRGRRVVGRSGAA